MYISYTIEYNTYISLYIYIRHSLCILPLVGNQFLTTNIHIAPASAPLTYIHTMYMCFSGTSTIYFIRPKYCALPVQSNETRERTTLFLIRSFSPFFSSLFCVRADPSVRSIRGEARDAAARRFDRQSAPTIDSNVSANPARVNTFARLREKVVA